MAEGEAVLAAHGLTCRYGDQEALVSLDLAVSAGEAVALLGANGSGKTTALRCLGGQLAPNGGEVTVAGANPHREPDGEVARRALAFVPDTPVFYRELTVAEHLRLVAASFDDREGAARGEAVLAELGLSGRLDARPHQLSSGQRQKVLLACVHARPFDALLLDEPVLRLDPASQAWLHNRLVAHRDAGVAIVVTTHQPAFAAGLAERVVRLDEGRVTADGDLAAFLARGEGGRIGYWTAPEAVVDADADDVALDADAAGLDAESPGIDAPDRGPGGGATP